MIIIDATVRTKDGLFSRFTDVAYLGYSSFSGWDAFQDSLWSRLRHSDIVIEVDNRDLSGLPEADRSIYREVIDDLVEEFPTKLRLA